MKRRGFTLLEILIVVGLIALLSSLLVMALGKMSTSAKRQQTTLILENARAMYADYDSVIHRHFVSYKDTFAIGNNVDMPCPQNVSNDFAANGSSVTAFSLDRNGYAVLMTRDVMNQLQQTTTNSTAIGKMSASALMRFTQSVTPSQFKSGNTYNVLDRVYVQISNPATLAITYTYYTCIQKNQTSPSVAPYDPGGSNFWIPSTFYGNDPTVSPPVGGDNSAPVLLDAWGNPIVFIPGGSLGTGVALNADGTIVVGSGALAAGGITFIMRSPDGRPFFASAGPDGDFSKGDDNLYSFEK